MIEVLVKLRPRKHKHAHEVRTETRTFTDLREAIRWMEAENLREDRVFDVASVRNQ